LLLGVPSKAAFATTIIATFGFEIAHYLDLEAHDGIPINRKLI